jgi:hypothetical protein
MYPLLLNSPFCFSFSNFIRFYRQVGLAHLVQSPIYGFHLYDEWESRNRTRLVGDRVNPIAGVALVKRHYHLALKSGGVIAITRLHDQLRHPRRMIR